jgi:DNA-binding SARP family transcriptional activator
MTRRVRLYLTGSLVLFDGETVIEGADLPGTQAQVIVALLAVNHLRPVSTIEIAEVVWAGQPPKSWKTTLKSIVSRIRLTMQPLGDVEIIGGVGWYQLVLPGDAIVDLLFAEAMVHDAEVGVHADDIGAAAAAAASAAMITSRPPLSDLDHGYAGSLTSQLELTRVRALQVLIEIWRRRRDYELMLGDGRRLVALDQLNETGHGAIIEAHLRVGHTAQALRAYEQCRAILAAEIGAEPNASLQSLYSEVLALT